MRRKQKKKKKKKKKKKDVTHLLLTLPHPLNRTVKERETEKQLPTIARATTATTFKQQPNNGQTTVKQTQKQTCKTKQNGNQQSPSIHIHEVGSLASVVVVTQEKRAVVSSVSKSVLLFWFSSYFLLLTSYFLLLSRQWLVASRLIVTCKR
jgi:hypothetical protein